MKSETLFRPDTGFGRNTEATFRDRLASMIGTLRVLAFDISALQAA